MPNRLQFEQSPYLLQHRENPVDWRPWGSEAFQTAREEDKPVFLSIGYSTCPWCHVMAHESFEDETVAEAINRELEKAEEIFMQGYNATNDILERLQIEKGTIWKE